MTINSEELPFHPELPYAGTSGHSGSDTSKERALDADKSGQTARRQAEALKFLQEQKTLGATWKELSQVTGLHHGTTSGVLSVLHKAGRIARLKERRNRCKVYVDLDSIKGRAVEGQGRKKNCPHCGGDL
jgi:hypothetical protein